MQKNIAAIYIAKPEFLSELCNELTDISEVIGNLVFSSQLQPEVCFAQDIWYAPKMITFDTISEAAHILRKAGRFWYMHAISHTGRQRLIADQLRKCPPLQRHFPLDSPIPAIGGFSLLDKNTLIYSTHRLKPWPDGQCQFIEDKINPPNRAYLKLWEAITFLGKLPQKGETALDLGASPGGWTVVMQSLGTHVAAVDKAALSPHVIQLPNVLFMQQSAFALDPDTLKQTYDWVLSDIACYPERAYALIMKWITSGKAKQMIFTIKFQGKTELSTLKQFQDIPHSRLINLFYNKHEATFFYPVSRPH